LTDWSRPYYKIDKLIAGEVGKICIVKGDRYPSKAQVGAWKELEVFYPYKISSLHEDRRCRFERNASLIDGGGDIALNDSTFLTDDSYRMGDVDGLIFDVKTFLDDDLSSRTGPVDGLLKPVYRTSSEVDHLS